MLISLNIVEEKMDNTVSAINVTHPVARRMGIRQIDDWAHFAFTVGWLVRHGADYWDLIISTTWSVDCCWSSHPRLSAIIIGFVQGLNADDMMTAVAGTKTMMMPLVGSVVGAELVNAEMAVVLLLVSLLLDV